MNITITPAAEKFMRRIVRFNGAAPGAGFRLKVKAGGCSGLSSEFSVEAAQPGDEGLDWNGLNVFLPADSAQLLDGYTIDFSDSIRESGLTFRNPNAPAASCGSHGAPGSHGGHAAPPAVATVAISSIVRKS